MQLKPIQINTSLEIILILQSRFFQNSLKTKEEFF